MMKTNKPAPTKPAAAPVSAHAKGKPAPVSTPARNTPRRPAK